MTTQAKRNKHNTKLPKIPSDKSMKQFLVKEIAATIKWEEAFLRADKEDAKDYYQKSNPDAHQCLNFVLLNQVRDSIRHKKAKLQKLRHLQKILKTLPDDILTESMAKAFAAQASSGIVIELRDGD